MVSKTDDALIADAQKLFSGFEIVVGESADEVSNEQYQQSVGELIRRGYSPSFTVNFKKE